MVFDDGVIRTNSQE